MKTLIKNFMSFYIHRYLFRVRVIAHTIKGFLIKDTKFLIYYTTMGSESRPPKEPKWFNYEVHEYIPPDLIAIAQQEGISIEYKTLIKKPKWAK